MTKSTALLLLAKSYSGCEGRRGGITALSLLTFLFMRTQAHPFLALLVFRVEVRFPSRQIDSIKAKPRVDSGIGLLVP